MCSYEAFVVEMTVWVLVKGAHERNPELLVEFGGEFLADAEDS